MEAASRITSRRDPQNNARGGGQERQDACQGLGGRCLHPGNVHLRCDQADPGPARVSGCAPPGDVQLRARDHHSLQRRAYRAAPTSAPDAPPRNGPGEKRGADGNFPGRPPPSNGHAAGSVPASLPQRVGNRPGITSRLPECQGAWGRSPEGKPPDPQPRQTVWGLRRPEAGSTPGTLACSQIGMLLPTCALR